LTASTHTYNKPTSKERASFETTSITMQQFTIIAALAATASAYSVSIQNNCNKPAYIWSCGTTLGEMQTLQPGSEPWSEAFYSKDGGSSGPSIYVSDGKSNTDGNIAQLEYFYQESIQKVWWDISLINGKPFPEIALGSDIENPPYDACKPVQCSGVGKCAGVYHTHEQLLGTHDCPPSNLIMKLCDSEGNWNAGKPSNGGQSTTTKESEPAATPTPSESSEAEAPSYTVAPVKTNTAPATTTTAAPVKGNAFAQVNDDGEVVVHTAYATTIVTKVVTANAPAPSGKITEGEDGEVHAKREQHAHAHAHAARAHSRSLKRHNHHA